MEGKITKIFYSDSDETVSRFVKSVFNEIFNKFYILEFTDNENVVAELIQKNKHDIYLIGENMGTTKGVDIIKKFSQLLPDKPFIFITSSTKCEKDIEVMRAGAVDYLPMSEISEYLLERSIRYSISAKKMEREIRENQLRLKEKENQLTALNASKDLLLSVIGHDLRGPISSIIQLVDLINEEALEEEVRLKILGDIRSQTGITLDLLDNILHWVNSQQNNFSLNKTKLNLQKLINNNIRLYSKNAAIKNISLKTENNYDMFINADEDMINIVIRNLISNAVKFTPENGKITIETKTDINNVIFSICDTGIGISEEKIRMLTGNQKIKSENGTNHEKGTGIGLKLCRELIGKHDGKLNIESKLEEGTVLWFTLPNSTASY